MTLLDSILVKKKSAYKPYRRDMARKRAVIPLIVYDCLIQLRIDDYIYITLRFLTMSNSNRICLTESAIYSSVYYNDVI